MNLKTKLNKPFPYVDKVQDKILLSFLFGAFIFVFLILFQPFGIVNISLHKVLFVFGYGIITFLVLLLSFLLYPILVPNFDSDKWTIRKMFFFILSQIFMISILNWFYTVCIGEQSIQQRSLLSFILITISVGIIPSSFFILLLERYLDWRNNRAANKISNDSTIKSKDLNDITLELGNHPNKLKLSLASLLCIKSSGNYIEIYTVQENLVHKQLLRCSLSLLNKQLEEYDHFKHCHRSFIANTLYLTKITGNARNFNLHLNHLNFTIPVSRSFPIQDIKK